MQMNLCLVWRRAMLMLMFEENVVEYVTVANPPVSI